MRLQTPGSSCWAAGRAEENDVMTKDKTTMEKTNHDKVKNPKEVNTTVCPKCDEPVTERESVKDRNIRCQICRFWWHPACGGLGQEEYELFLRLAGLGSPNLWQCLTCKVGMGDLALRWEKTGKMVAENKEKINILENKVEKPEERGDNLEHELKKTKEERDCLHMRISVLQETAMKRSLAETDERNNNRNNIIIHRVPESKSSKPLERQAHDLDTIQIIFKKLGLSNIIKA